MDNLFGLTWAEIIVIGILLILNYKLHRIGLQLQAIHEAMLRRWDM